MGLPRSPLHPSPPFPTWTHPASPRGSGSRATSAMRASNSSLGNGIHPRISCPLHGSLRSQLLLPSLGQPTSRREGENCGIDSWVCCCVRPDIHRVRRSPMSGQCWPYIGKCPSKTAGTRRPLWTSSQCQQTVELAVPDAAPAWPGLGSSPERLIAVPRHGHSFVHSRHSQADSAKMDKVCFCVCLEVPCTETSSTPFSPLSRCCELHWPRCWSPGQAQEGIDGDGSACF